tara:strand:- start:10 stop:498 length:489 start_codon:yes stop_codon:yes gene_type:complete
MTLEEYLSTIIGSKPGQWRASNVPTFMHRIVPSRTPGSDFELQEHNVLLNFTEDIRFSMAWGLVADRNYNEPWLEKLANKRADVVMLDLLFNSTLVYREKLVAADNWRCILPQPLKSETPPYKVPERRMQLARLVHSLVGPDTSFGTYFKRVGMVSADIPWP